MSYHFPSTRREATAKMATHRKMEVEGDEAQLPEGEPDLDLLAQRYHCLRLKFLRSDGIQRTSVLAITKIIIELTDSSRASGLAQRRSHEGTNLMIMSWSFMKRMGRSYLAITTGHYM